MKRKLVVPLLLVAAAIGLFLTLKHLDEGARVEVASSGAAPRYTLVDASWTRYDADGQPALTGQASQIVYYDDRSGTAETLEVEALGIGGAPWHLSAPSAVLPAGQRRFELQGDVEVTGKWPDNGEDLHASTADLWIDPDAHQFQTDAPVAWDSDSREGSSLGLRADWRARSLTLPRDVKMRYRLPAGASAPGSR